MFQIYMYIIWLTNNMFTRCNKNRLNCL